MLPALEYLFVYRECKMIVKLAKKVSRTAKRYIRAVEAHDDGINADPAYMIENRTFVEEPAEMDSSSEADKEAEEEELDVRESASSIDLSDSSTEEDDEAYGEAVRRGDHGCERYIEPMDTAVL